jgi:hypothetical protein
MMDRIEVSVVHRVTYTFPSLTEKCSAHGHPLCVHCARNPGNCATDMGSCSVYKDTGMHWDTCPNRIRGPLESE